MYNSLKMVVCECALILSVFYEPAGPVAPGVSVHIMLCCTYQSCQLEELSQLWFWHCAV